MKYKFDIVVEYFVNYFNVCRGDVDLIVVVCFGLGNFKEWEYV